MERSVDKELKLSIPTIAFDSNIVQLIMQLEA